MSEGFFECQRLFNKTMKTEQKNWIEDVLGAADAIQQVTADEVLFTGVRERLYSHTKQQQTVPMRNVWAAAAGFVLLLSLNFVLLRQTDNRPVNGDNSLLTQNKFDIYSQP